MTPLMLRIAMGAEDDRLLDIIRDLERMPDKSDRERDTLALAQARLEQITAPGKEEV